VINRVTDDLIKKIPDLKENGLNVGRAIHNAILNGGSTARNIADLLHGTWLGHPLHPVLTDLTVGAWSLGALFDAVAAINGSEHAERMADDLTAIGTASAIPTALTGITEYSTIPRSAADSGALHGLLNSASFLLYLLSLKDRGNGNRSRAVVFSTTAFSFVILSAWLGGELVYRLRVGVNHADSPTGPPEWTPILAETELAEHEARRVEVEGLPVLLYRYGGTVHAIGAICSHAGGPLEEGEFEGFCVECPWHNSVFDLRDGSIVHGPATHTQPDYACRIQSGQIEVRVKNSDD
jgi:nitrite reductase/ring-hydroxylating ferredoxin subunit/uncharacterized membrane protein